MYLIESEINEQPAVIHRIITEQAENAKRIAAAIREFNPTFVCIAARGTSDNAGRYAQYLMGIEARLPVMLATPSVHTLYEAAPDLSRALVIGISQSGHSEDIYRVITDARSQGALTLSITNNASSRIAQTAAYHFDLLAGEELSIAATKTYTAQLTAVALLVATLVDKSELYSQLSTLSDLVKDTLLLSEAIPRWTERYRYMEHFASIGRGYNYCTAFEISLKVKELCSVISEQYSEADFRHGPIAIIKPGFPALVVAPDGKPVHGLIDLLEMLRQRKAECLVISNHPDALGFAKNGMRLLQQPEWLTPITAVIPGQVFAINLALVRGLPVDKPEGLTKVTNTI